MFEETLFQKTADGKPFADVLREQGIIVGIKVDKVKQKTKLSDLHALKIR